MAELLPPEEFRTALEDAIKGREAKNASFSQAWANGEPGNYFQIFVVQQTSDNTASATVHYGEFRAVVPEPAAGGLCLLALAAAAAAGRVRLPRRVRG